MARKIIVVVVALALVVLGWWFTHRGPAATEMVKSTEVGLMAQDSSGQVADASLTGTGDMVSLLNRNESLACTFSYLDPTTGESSVGTSYTNNGSYRVTVTTSSAGASYETNIIGVGDSLYMWGESADGAMALKLPNTLAAGAVSEEGQPASPVDFLREEDAAVQYSCNPWSVQSDSFTPPTSITFIDMSALMQGMPFDGLVPDDISGE